MPKRIEVSAHGGPENMRWVDFDLRDPGADEVQIRHTAVGVNYIDVYHRTGLYPTSEPPFPLGVEGAGVVESVGPDVTAFEPGDRVAYGGAPLGGYAEKRNIQVGRLVKLPDEIEDEKAAAMMLKGLTAYYLLRLTYPVQAGDTVLVHAAAGGVGLLLCQWAKHLGARVIGTVGSKEKGKLASEHGCDHPILYRDETVAKKVFELTGGDGVEVVYDSVGKDTFDESLDCLATRGMLVLYGQSSGPVPPFDLRQLGIKGSLFVTRPSLTHYTGTRKELLTGADELFDVVQKGIVKVEIGQTYPLAKAADSHRDLEGRQTVGSTVLVP